MSMKHIWVCTCRTETDVEPEVFSAGSVFQCPGCMKVFGCVRKKIGPKVWVEIQPSDVAFHRLLEETIEEDEHDAHHE